MADVGEKSHEDIEKGMCTNTHPVTDDSDGSLCFTDAEDQSWHSPYNSHYAGSSYDEFHLSGASDSEVGGVRDKELCRNSCFSDCSLEVDLEAGLPDVNLSSTKADKDCRICHLSLEGTPESGTPMELGCSCKHDLAAAHKQCAETWFKIRGNKVCEICGSTAKNVVLASDAEVVEQWNEAVNNPPPTSPSEPRRFWRGHRFLNFLLACMVFAFVISWLFHFNVPG